MDSNISLRKIMFTLMVLLMGVNPLFAHYMWVETKPTGEKGKEHEVRVYFGEYTYGLLEEVGGESFERMKKFKVWLVAPNGEKEQMTFVPSKEFYVSTFTPHSDGTYSIILDNDEIDVLDYTEYDFGIFKTHYHSVAKVAVGSGGSAFVSDNPSGITIVDLTEGTLKKGGELSLKVLYKGEPLTDSEISIFIEDQWSKKMWTDENGQVSLTLPWDKKYIVEVTKKEEVPGEYNGLSYEFIYHCATYYIDGVK